VGDHAQDVNGLFNEEEYRAILVDTQTVNFSVYPFSLAMSIPSVQGQFSRARGA
jgi:hypothetical protein